MASKKLNDLLRLGMKSIPDMRQIAAGLSGPGIDTRYWVSYGTVGTIDDEGNLNITDSHAVFIGPEGVDVEVMLEPIGVHCHCTYAGVYGGAHCSIMAPIRAGDRVLVALPGGDSTLPPIIVAILHDAQSTVPLDDDHKPTFRNDRVLISATGIPIDIRVGKDSKIKVGTDGTVTIEAKKSVVKASEESDVETPKHVVKSDAIHLGADSLTPQEGAVTGMGIDPFTGVSYFILGNASVTVMAKK